MNFCNRIASFGLILFEFFGCNDPVKAPGPVASDIQKNAVISCEKQPSRFPSLQEKNAPAGMIWIPAGEFLMGTDELNSYPQEQPAHSVKLSGFYIDKTEVTNAQFQKFVEATNYKTIAEQKPDWEELKKEVPPGTPKPPESDLVPASLVFSAPEHPVGIEDFRQWWKWVPGADWRHPEGPASSIIGKENYPVVQIAWDDAAAYAKWAGKRLPTEAEWEYAARGGLEQKRYGWGNDFKLNGQQMANTYQGIFPNKDEGMDGFIGIAPIASFTCNGYGLFDMTGNVWEWCSDWYDANYYKQLAKNNSVTVNPKGPEKSYDPEEPFSIKRVIKGGSFLCAENYCLNYRPSARRGTAYDTGASHIGFRCAEDAKE